VTELVRFAKGGEAVVTAIGGDHVTLSSTTSAPPGATVEGALADGTPFRVKVRGCKRDAASDRFVIDGRVIDLSRAVRDRLTQSASNAERGQPETHGDDGGK
jgi:hypothetical protein